MTGTTDKTETITVSRNTDQIVDGVKSFIEDYNALIDKLNSLIEEDTDYREYAPLTDAQKKEMSEKEIELGRRRPKRACCAMTAQFRPSFSRCAVRSISVRPAVRLRFTISVSKLASGKQKASWLWMRTVKRRFAQLLRAIRTAWSLCLRVSRVLQASSIKFLQIQQAPALSAATAEARWWKSPGYAETASDKDNTLYNTIQQIDQKIKDLKAAYEQEKTRYWNKFNAMESMIQQMSSQSSWLAQQFGY